MKTRTRTLICAALAVAGLTTPALFTSCSDNEGWYPEHPGVINSFYDSNLVGTWRLAQVNGTPVDGTTVNYLQFDGNGDGAYYFYVDGEERATDIEYYCQGSDSAITHTALTIAYANGIPESTSLYWFTGTKLWLQWGSGNGTTTYVYEPVNGVPW